MASIRHCREDFKSVFGRVLEHLTFSGIHKTYFMLQKFVYHIFQSRFKRLNFRIFLKSHFWCTSEWFSTHSNRIHRLRHQMQKQKRKSIYFVQKAIRFIWCQLPTLLICDNTIFYEIRWYLIPRGFRTSTTLNKFFDALIRAVIPWM